MPWRRRVKDAGDGGGALDLPGGFLDFADDGLGLVLVVVAAVLAAVVALPLVLLAVGAALEIALLIALLPVFVLVRTLFGVSWEVEVRDTGTGVVWQVVHTEKVRGWGASGTRIGDLAEALRLGTFTPAEPALEVTLTRDPVCMGDDTVDNTQVVRLSSRGTVPTVADLLARLVQDGPFVSVMGGPTTWLLREGRRGGRPLAALQLHTEDDRRLVARPLVDTSGRIAAGGAFHLDYLLQDDVDDLVARVRADPRRKGSYRAAPRTQPPG